METTENSPLAAYEDTLFHIELIGRKITKLVAAQVEAERQVLHRAGRDHSAGRLDVDGLWELYRRYRDLVCAEDENGKRAYVHRPGFSELWNESISLHSSRIALMAKTAWLLKRYEPNTDGAWSGENPLMPQDQRPRDGQCVVYILFDDHNVPCYVGSTEKFKTRIDCHTREKSFARWVAYPCADRESAYQMEDRLLKEHKPYLNRKASR